MKKFAEAGLLEIENLDYVAELICGLNINSKMPLGEIRMHIDEVLPIDTKDNVGIYCDLVTTCSKNNVCCIPEKAKDLTISISNQIKQLSGGNITDFTDIPDDSKFEFIKEISDEIE